MQGVSISGVIDSGDNLPQDADTITPLREWNCAAYVRDPITAEKGKGASATPKTG